MLTIFHTIILGIVEGVTEFLPISSTAHLILVSHVLKLPQSEFLKTFEIAIQLGAILSVVVLYWRKLLDFEVIKRLIVAFVPTGIIGLIFYQLIKRYLFENTAVILSALLLGGIFIIVFELFYKVSREESANISTISYTKCLVIGLFQSVAIIPGVSRAAATVIGGLVLGINRKTIVEFSFLLAVPTMAAATGLDILKSYQGLNGPELSYLVVGFITSFMVALVSIKFLLRYIKTNNFKAFGIYRIAIAILFWIGIK